MHTTKNQFANLAIIEESDTDEETSQIDEDNETTPLPVEDEQDDVSIHVVEHEEPTVEEPTVEEEEENPFLDDSVVIYLDNSNNSPTTNPPGYSVWVGGHVRGDVGSGAVKVDKMDTKVPLTITPSVLVNGELLTWYYNYGWYSGSNLTGPFQNGCTIKIPNVNMSKLDKFKSALNFLDNLDTLPENCLGSNLHQKLYADKCLGSLALLKYELPVNDWNAKVRPWLTKNGLVEDFNSAFSIVDTVRELPNKRLNLKRGDRVALRRSNNQFLHHYVSLSVERRLLLDNLKL